MQTVYDLNQGDMIPKEVEDYDGILIAGQHITIRLSKGDVWHVYGDDPMKPAMIYTPGTFIHGQRGGVHIHGGTQLIK